MNTSIILFFFQYFHFCKKNTLIFFNWLVLLNWWRGTKNEAKQSYPTTANILLSDRRINFFTPFRKEVQSNYHYLETQKIAFQLDKWSNKLLNESIFPSGSLCRQTQQENKAITLGYLIPKAWIENF